jgi:hypothetical protein
MTGGEEQTLLVEFRCQHAADLPWAYDRDHALCVNRAVIDAADVEEQPSVA